MPTPGAETLLVLDTNVAIALLNGQRGMDLWVRRFTSMILPVPVLGELRFGALKSGRSKKNLERIEELARSCEIRGTTAATAKIYAEERANLRRKGRPIPENDLWIASICLECRLPLATYDRHFEEIDTLRLQSPPERNG